jgi:hypothetical protein
MSDRKWVTEPDEYVCTLSEELQTMAEEELREDKHSRQTALASMREWIKQNPRIKNCRMGKPHRPHLKPQLTCEFQMRVSFCDSCASKNSA